ncbi:hypothetical protein D3C71_1509600 [compost metagenome]
MAVTGAHPQAEHRGDVDDAARPLGTSQALRGALGHTPDTVEVGREHAAPVLFADLQHPLAVADTRVVEHHVNYAISGFGVIECGFDTGAVGDIQRYRQRLTTVLVNRLGQLLQALHPACRQHHSRSGTNGNPCQVFANATGGTGDQHGFIGEREGGMGKGDCFVHCRCPVDKRSRHQMDACRM